ncbi:MAG: MFS transporter [Chloroflexi bacterium]|nr:MFS transporter [Chloroflexota bacterium]
MASNTTVSANTITKWGPIQLLSGISKKNMTIYVIGSAFMMIFSTFVPQAQPFILTEILHIPADQQGQLSGYLGFAHTLVGLIMPGVWGAISDKTGRRIVYAIGFLITAIGVAIYPLAGSLVMLYLIRMLFATGTNASMTMSNTLLGDYVDKKDRGKAYGIVAAAGGIGALLTVFLFLRLPSIFQNAGFSAANAGRYTFWIVALFGILAMSIVGFGLMGKTLRQSQEKRSVLLIAQEALRAARDPRISLAYATNFVSSSAISVVGTFFTLWIVTYGTTQAGLTSAAALARAGMIIGISQLSTLIAAPIFGILSDKIGRIQAVSLATGLTAIFFAATALISNPLSGMMILLGFLIGLVQISGVITGGALVAAQAPDSVRGAVMGFYGFCGALGIMATFLISGFLFDHWIYQGPFILSAVCCAIVAVWGLLIKNKDKKGA